MEKETIKYTLKDIGIFKLYRLEHDARIADDRLRKDFSYREYKNINEVLEMLIANGFNKDNITII